MRETIGRNKNRESNDFYPTNPTCVQDIIKAENLRGLSILENSAGNGHIAKELIAAGNTVFCIDIKQRDYPLDLCQNFLHTKLDKRFNVAVYNPPFSLFSRFVEKTFEYTDRQIVFCRLQILECKERYADIFSKGYLETVYVYSSRQFTNENMAANSMCFCWVVLDKRNNKEPRIRWIQNRVALDGQISLDDIKK